MNNDFSSTFNTHAIQFMSTNSQVRTLNGNTVRLFDNNGADPYILNASSATHVINLNLRGDGDTEDPLLIRLNSTGGLTFNGTIDNQGSNINVQGNTFTANTVTFNGIISGSGGLFQTNSNITSIFNAANTYTGTNTVDEGTIRLGQAGASFGGATSAVRLSAGAVMDLNGFDTTVRYVTERGSGNGGIVQLGGGTLTIQDDGSTTRFQNSINGTGNIVYDSATTSVMSLYNAQGWTGSTTVKGGTLTSAGAMQTAAVAVEGGIFRVTGSDNRLAANPSVTLSGGTFNPRTNETIQSLTATGGLLDIESGRTLALQNGGSIGTSVSMRGGTLRLNSGSLLYNSTDANNTTAVIIDNGSTLRGTGTIGGNTTISGTHQPGNSPGVQTFTGDLSYSSSSVFAWEIDYALDATGLGTRGTQFSGVDVGGDLNIASGAEFRVVTNQSIDFDGGPGLGFWGQNHVWDNIFQVAGAITGDFGNDIFVNVYDTNGTLLDISPVGTFTVTGTTVSYTAIPEPGTLVLALLTGVAALGTARLRKKKA